jgi:hypothetical protein
VVTSRPGPAPTTGTETQAVPRATCECARHLPCSSAVAFAATDLSLNKALVKHLEGQLLAIARSAQRAEVDNGDAPQLLAVVRAGYRRR